ncbi:LysR family transcriptional regulator [Shouchella shacheensis]|uniref:LysR family transcriptional regulator n=1 Tax=Shouchella shacheensis TaxID=1649580 RepID=UPI00073FD092|nr:LysR family transcriptional regulator [Shouchella shacheensis]
MKIDEDQLLATLKQAGTIRGAAKRLYISQPAISQRLKQVEEKWGEPLFIRTHKQLLLTPAGEEVVRFAEQRLAEEKRLQERLSQLTGTIRGTLSLGVSSVFGQYVLPNVLHVYMQKYPEVKIDLQTGLSSFISSSKENFHISITRGEPALPHSSERLLRERLYLVEKASSLAPPKKQVFIEFQSDAGMESMINEWFVQEGGRKPDQVIKVDQIETCKQLMACGIGMAVLPEMATQNLPEDDYQFEPLILKGETLMRHTYSSCSDYHRTLPQVNAFLEVLGQQVRGSKEAL